MQTILTGAVVLLGATGNAQQGPNADAKVVDAPGEIEVRSFRGLRATAGILR